MRARMASCAPLLIGAAACGPAPTRIVEVVHQVELWDDEGGSAFCADMGERWAPYSAADVSNSRRPGDDGVGGVCVIPVRASHEAFVLQSVTCTRKRGDGDLQVHLEPGVHDSIELRLTEATPTVAVPLGRGIVLRRPLWIDVMDPRYNLGCTVVGYFAYPDEPVAEGETAPVRPWGPDFERLDERPGAPK